MYYLYAAAGIAFTTIATPIVALISLQLIRIRSVPSGLPWVGLKNKRFLPKLRANLREVVAGREPLNEGYEKYSKHGKACVLPGLQWPDVALPPSDIAWLTAKPEHVLSASKVQEDIIAFSYMSHGPDAAARADFTVIRRDLTRNLSKVLPDIIDEVHMCFDEMIKADSKDWSEVKIFHIITETSRRLSNRLFVGLPLCRDKRYIGGLETWELVLGVGSAVVRYLIPPILKPHLAKIVAIPVRFQAWRLKRLLLPQIRGRLARQNQSDGSKVDAVQPHDVLQWLLDAEAERRVGRGMSIDDIAEKTIMFNFFGRILCFHDYDFVSPLTYRCYSRPHSRIELRLNLDGHSLLRKRGISHHRASRRGRERYSET